VVSGSPDDVNLIGEVVSGSPDDANPIGEVVSGSPDDANPIEEVVSGSPDGILCVHFVRDRFSDGIAFPWLWSCDVAKVQKVFESARKCPVFFITGKSGRSFSSRGGCNRKKISKFAPKIKTRKACKRAIR